VPLSLNPIQIEAVTTTNKQKSPKRWTTPIPIIGASNLASNHVCVDSPLSTSSREEQTNTNTNIHDDHNASSVAHTPKALSVESIETDLKATKSPLSADANVFQPSSKLNVFAPIYDPFGNIAYCESPQSVQSLSYWKNVLI
jgi:hypothetical protein